MSASIPLDMIPKEGREEARKKMELSFHFADVRRVKGKRFFGVKKQGIEPH